MGDGQFTMQKMVMMLGVTEMVQSALKVRGAPAPPARQPGPRRGRHAPDLSSP